MDPEGVVIKPWVQNHRSNSHKQDLSKIISWIKTNHHQILKNQKAWISIYMKVYLIESWYVQLCMVHISQNTQGIRKITVSVEIIPSQIIWIKAKNFLQLLNRFKYYRVLAFVFNIFCNIILLFYFLNWSFGIRISGKSCMIFLSGDFQHVSVNMWNLTDWQMHFIQTIDVILLCINIFLNTLVTYLIFRTSQYQKQVAWPEF